MAKNLRGDRPGLARSEAQGLRAEQLTTSGFYAAKSALAKGRLPEHLRERQREIVDALATPEGALSELEAVAVKAVLLSEVGDDWLQRQIAEGRGFDSMARLLRDYIATLNASRKMLETIYVLRSKAHGGALDLGEEMRRLEDKRAKARAAAAEVVDHDSE